MASDRIIAYIRKQFYNVAKKYELKTVIEKTCANSLRVPFVRTICPDAKYIFIYRDGIDAAASAKKRWQAPLDIPYLLKKARFVPKYDLPGYAMKYLGNRVHRFLTKEQRLATWGPRMDGIDDLVKTYSLIEVCALQWQACVEKAWKGLQDLPKEQLFSISYEHFVRQPQQGLKEITDFAGISCTAREIEDAVLSVSAKSIGKGHGKLSPAEYERVLSHIGLTLREFGYET
jgi:hypothetical protein